MTARMTILRENENRKSLYRDRSRTHEAGTNN